MNTPKNLVCWLDFKVCPSKYKSGEDSGCFFAEWNCKTAVLSEFKFSKWSLAQFSKSEFVILADLYKISTVGAFMSELASSAYNIKNARSINKAKSLIKMLKTLGPRILPWPMPVLFIIFF